MARRNRQRKSALSASRIDDMFASTLSNLRSMCDLYDSGKYEIFLPTSVEIGKVLTEGNAMRYRNSVKFPSLDRSPERHSLTPYVPLVFAKLKQNPNDVQFRPFFANNPSWPSERKTFKHWWNREIIFVASCAPPDMSFGLIPLEQAKQVPYDEREKMTRRNFITYLRNSMGAHMASDPVALIEELHDARSWSADLSIGDENNNVSLSDGTLPCSELPIQGMTRQIAEEVLVAFSSLRMNSAMQ